MFDKVYRVRTTEISFIFHFDWYPEMQCIHPPEYSFISASLQCFPHCRQS